MARLKKARFWGGLALLLTSITLPMLVNAAPPPALPSPPFPNIATLGIPGTAGGDGLPEVANEIAISNFNPSLMVTGSNWTLGTSGVYNFVEFNTSENGGATWDAQKLQAGFPFSPPIPGIPSPLFTFDPDVASDAAGRRFGSFAGASNTAAGPSDIFVTTFDTAGVQGPVVPVFAPPAFGVGTLQESPRIAADDSASLATQNNVYVAWTSGFPVGQVIRAARSTNHAALGTFTEPASGGLLLSPSTTTVSDTVGDERDPDVGTGPSGEVYVSWHDHGAGKIMVDKSIDGGANYNANGADITAVTLNVNSFHTPIPAAPHNFSYLAGGGLITVGGIDVSPEIAVDKSNGPFRGTVYIVYADKLFLSPDYDIFLIRSTDGGATWSPPIRVNDDTPFNGQDQFNPAICVDDVTGDVNISWYDTREDPTNTHTQTYYTRTNTGGAPIVTFAPNINVRATTTGAPIAPQSPGTNIADYGKYSGIACTSNLVFPNWTDYRHGDADPDPETVKLVVATGQGIRVSPGTVDFGTVCSGATVDRTIQVCNTGTTPLLITNVYTSDLAGVATACPGFSVLGPPSNPATPLTVSPGVCVNFTIRFAPTPGVPPAGPASCHVTVQSTDPANPLTTVSLTATVGTPVASIDTSLIDFGTVCPLSSTQRTLQICNTGTCDLRVAPGPMYFVGDPGFSTLTGAPGPPVFISHDFCYPFNFVYVPPAGTPAGVKMATVQFATSDPGNPTLTVTLKATLGAPNIEVNPFNPAPAPGGNFAIDFGTVCPGQVVQTALSVFNTGNCDLSVTSIIPDPGNPVDFTLLSRPATKTRISPDAHVDYTIRFTPTGAAGLRTASFTINSNDPVNPVLLVTVRGTVGAPALRVQGCPLDFGTVPVGSPTTGRKTFQICNVGTCNLVVTGITLTPLPGTLPGEFSLLEPAPTAGPPGAGPLTVSHDFCIPFHIVFTPVSVGPKSATLTVTSNDPTVPSFMCTVTAATASGSGGSLAGPTAAPGICFPPTVIRDFGCSSRMMPVFTNNGIGTLKIGTITITGDPGGNYEIQGAPPFGAVLQPGQVLGGGGLAIVFHPGTVARDLTATLNIQILDPISMALITTVTAPLHGEGVKPGGRLLVTRGGVAVPTVDMITLQRSLGGRQVTLFSVRGKGLKTVMTPCRTFQYQIEIGGADTYAFPGLPVGSPPMAVANGYLPPGDYLFTVQLGAQVKQTTLHVEQCTFKELTLPF